VWRRRLPARARRAGCGRCGSRVRRKAGTGNAASRATVQRGGRFGPRDDRGACRDRAPVGGAGCAYLEAASRWLSWMQASTRRLPALVSISIDLLAICRNSVRPFTSSSRRAPVLESTGFIV
jgi:hypothetical protein